MSWLDGNTTEKIGGRDTDISQIGSSLRQVPPRIAVMLSDLETHLKQAELQIQDLIREVDAERVDAED